MSRGPPVLKPSFRRGGDALLLSLGVVRGIVFLILAFALLSSDGVGEVLRGGVSERTVPLGPRLGGFGRVLLLDLLTIGFVVASEYVNVVAKLVIAQWRQE